MTNLSPHARAIHERINEKGFMLGIPTGLALAWHHPLEDHVMREAFAELVRVGLVVETAITDRVSRYQLKKHADNAD